MPLQNTNSEATIYRNAVQKCTSSSSEDGLDISDESNLLNNLVLDVNRVEADRELTHRSQGMVDDEQPSTSRQGMQGHQQAKETSPEEQATNMVRLAEHARASMSPPKGELLLNNLQENIPDKVCKQYKDVASMDVGGHVDETLQEKIMSSQYVDFSKLLSRDRIIVQEEDRMELIVRNGKAFWTPVASEGVVITGFNKWEQAFGVYSNIYMGRHPERAGELIEYNHVIHLISQNYVWDNVYEYDKDFRLHIARHSGRNWAIILQQAWSMCLCDRLTGKHESTPTHNGNGNYSQQNHIHARNFKDYCKRFNKEKCNLGKSCRYEHRCSYCNKFGHGVIVCRKLIFDREKGGDKPTSKCKGVDN